MKTDNFDEAFRRKIESFHPPFNDDEIDRIQGYVHKHIPLNFWQRFGHTFTYTLGSIVIVSLLSTIIYQANENKSLLKKISDLNSKLENVATPVVSDNTPKAMTLVKTDTVFVTKYVTKQISKESDDIAENSNIEEPIDIPETQSTTTSDEISEKLANSETIFSETKEFVNSENKTKNVAKNNSIEQVAKLPKRAERTESKLQLNDLVDAKTNKSLQNENPNNSREANITAAKTPAESIVSIEKKTELLVEQNYKSLNISELRSKFYVPSSASVFQNLSDKKFVIPHFSIKPKEHKSFRFPSIAMPNLKYRVGLGTNADFGQIGTSLLTDILFAKRWSITTGINIASLGFKHFDDEDDFKRITDKDFRNEHPINIPIGGSIDDIEEYRLLLRVPVMLNYRLPIRKDYTVLFSTGTDFDVHLKQFTTYSHENFYIKEKKEGIRERIPVVPFNNWITAVGVEKRWNRFAIQFSPYFTYQFKQLSYRKENFAFGFKLNGFYRLSR